MLANRYHHNGTAFTVDERDQFGLHGLLPPIVESLDTQIQRVRAEFDAAHGTATNPTTPPAQTCCARTPILRSPPPSSLKLRG